MTMKPGEPLSRAILLLAGLLGAAGIGLAAAANHLDDPRGFSAAATVCLANAPALIALYAGRASIRLASLAALVIAFGAILFSADMLLRYFYGIRVFAGAAPTGGVAMIAGWLVVAVSAILPKPQA
ncbi:DUF423 domain-containing protein [Rhizobiaceae bacterium BDR2-2]|uniref:DUF423 domain-containing protein n=1 Tax=Ectorhizobium quercum TaxID=2965071 RepID=A0AAE3N0M4_9HYPH|nr:DUF423 domain-containing protein [Ectorhizobium quercum]MCX8996662.1 DUF423 domain-containing protein [Ectorhizobium quercum]